MPEPIEPPALRLVPLEDTVLDGPYECPSCEGHMMLDATFLDQVDTAITCPYCCRHVRAE